MSAEVFWLLVFVVAVLAGPFVTLKAYARWRQSRGKRGDKE